MGRGKEASPGDNEVGLGGDGRLSGLAGWAAVQRGARRGGRAMCWREGSQSSCSEAAAEQKCRPAKSSPPVPRFKGNRRSGRPGHRGGLGPTLSSPDAAASCPCSLLGSPARPQGWLCSALLQGGGKGGNHALMCLLSAGSISQVSAVPHPPACIPPSVPGPKLPFHPSFQLLSVTQHFPTHSPVCLFGF